MNELWQAHKKTILLSLAACVALFGAFALGRYTVPTKIVEKEVRVVDKQIEYKDRVVTQKVYVTAKQNDVHKEVTTVKHPDGTVETKVVIDDRSKENTASSMSSVSDKTVSEKMHSEVDKLKIVSNEKPQWRIGARVEVGALVVPKLQPMLGAGITVERRILGPVFMGVSVSGDFGFNAAGFTGPYGFKLGPTVSVEF